MIEAYFTLKFWLTIIPISIVVLCIIMNIAIAIFVEIRIKRNKRYLLKHGFEHHLKSVHNWCYRKDGIEILEHRLSQYSLRKIKKIMNGV